MIARALLKRAKRLLWEMSHSRWYIPLVGLLCIVAGATLLVPITALVIVGVMLRPQRWRVLWLVTSLAAGIGAAILAHTLQAQGLEQVHQAFPELAASAIWQRTMVWIAEYGLLALAAVAALPLPQTPALVACALSRLSLPGIFLAVAAGKLVKYGILAWMVATFPERFIHHLHRDDPR
jgi:membrane protein YqaA with SNARE-associated domain